MRDTLNLIHDLADRGVGIRNVADPIKGDSSSPADPMAQLAVVLLALFAQMERTYTASSVPPAPVLLSPRRAGAWAGPASSTRRGSPTRPTYATPDTPSPRSSPRAASPAPASTATSRPARPNRPPQDDRPSERRALCGGILHDCTSDPFIRS
jgi:hypothetical protein